MQVAPRYDDVVAEVRSFLAGRIDACLAAGLRREQLVIDPGFGFGKTLEHNLELLAGLDRFLELDVPLLVGLSRKSMIGGVTGRPLGERLAGSVAAATLAVWKGAHIIRAHHVAETADALAIARAVRAGRE
jgi:dihydropteroate synthase